MPLGCNDRTRPGRGRASVPRYSPSSRAQGLTGQRSPTRMPVPVPPAGARGPIQKNERRAEPMKKADLVDAISWKGMQCRRDIGFRAVQREKNA